MFTYVVNVFPAFSRPSTVVRATFRAGCRWAHPVGIAVKTCSSGRRKVTPATRTCGSTPVAATGGHVLLDGITLADLPTGLTRPLTEAGVTLTDLGRAVDVHAPDRLLPITASTGPHPGLPTDTQPQLTAMLTQAHGASIVVEAIYPRRDTHVAGLRTFGADVTTDGPRIRIRGPVRLTAADVRGDDIRTAAAYVIAALAADGTSSIRGTHHLRRGYQRLLPTLAALGADATITAAETRHP